MRERLDIWFAWFLIIGFGVSLDACKLEQSVASQNVSYLYQAENDAFRFENAVLKHADRSTVFLRFSEDQFAVSRQEDGSQSIAYTIRFKLLTSYASPEAVDSGQVVRKSLAYTKGSWRYDSLSLNKLEDRNYILECTLKDLNSTKTFTSYVDVLRSPSSVQQSYLINSLSRGWCFSPNLPSPDSLVITKLGSDPILYARYYKRDFPIAAPPFISTAPKPFDFTPDSVFVLQKQNQGSVLHLTRTGFYQVTDDTSHRPGCTIFSFGTYFPEAKTVLDLALPLRYITTNEEYDQIMSSEYLKKEVDAFWLKTGGNPQRARTLIQAFYERVQYANQYFTSYLEGWKTDRGMCYVIFGPPDVVHRSTATETWTYGADGSYSALSLTFTKVVNPFSNNDYRLNRSSSLKTPWYRAVEFWRQGRVLKYE